MEIRQNSNGGYTLSGTSDELGILITLITAVTGTQAMTRRETMGPLTVVCTDWYGKDKEVS